MATNSVYEKIEKTIYNSEPLSDEEQAVIDKEIEGEMMDTDHLYDSVQNNSQRSSGSPDYYMGTYKNGKLFESFVNNDYLDLKNEAKKIIREAFHGQDSWTDKMSSLVKKRDSLAQSYSEALLEAISGDEDGEGEKMNFIITEINKHLEKLETITQPGRSFMHGEKGTNDSKWSPNGEFGRCDTGRGGLSISRSDLPKLQLRATLKENRPFPKEEAYDSVEHFLRTFENVVHSANMDIQKVWRLYIPLTVSYDYDSFVKKDLLGGCKSWDQARLLLGEKFSDAQTRLQARRDVMNIKMLSYETAEEYTLRFGRLVKKANYSRNMMGLMSEAFFFGFPEDWQTNINTVMLSTSKKSTELCTVDEISKVASDINGSKTPGSSVVKRRIDNGDDSYHGGKNKKKRTRHEGEKSGHSSFFCPRHGGANSTHNEADCFYNKVKRGENMVSRNTKNTFLGKDNRPFKSTGNFNNPCKWCGDQFFKGHTCEEYRRNRAHRGGHLSSSKDESVLHIEADSEDEKSSKRQTREEDIDMFDCKYKQQHAKSESPFTNLITPIIIENTKLLGKIDCGSDISCINTYVLENLFKNKNIKVNKINGTLRFLTGSSPKRLGQTEPLTVVYTNNISFTHSFEVVNFANIMSTEFDILLGKDILPKLNIGLTGVAYRWPDDPAKEDAQFENINFDTENKINPDVNSDYGTEAQRKLFFESIHDAITENEKVQLGTFCTIPESIVRIPIKPHANCYTRQYPIPHHLKPEIAAQLKEWLDTGLVKETKPSARFNSPLLPVPKKDEHGNQTKSRICMDLRKINSNTEETHQENHVVPNITDILAKVKQDGLVLSKIDLSQAYNFFSVAPESQEVLSFTFNNKTYCWKGCAFGLKTITQQFCRVMDIIFSDFDTGIASYVDDCVLWSRTPEEHTILVKRVIQRLTEVNLKVNFKKSTFFKTSIYMLGFIIGPSVTKIDFRKLSNINQWPIPKTAKAVRQLMGVISYMRDYVPQITKIAAPIDALRNDDDVKHKWTDLHTQRLEALKQILLSNAVLHAPDMAKKFYLATDASLYGLSACLFQKDSLGRAKYIAFVSKSLSPAQRNWSTNRRETAAIILGLVKFRPLLYGHPIPFEVQTDHRSLVYLFTTPIPNRTIQTFIEVLSEFNFTVTHIKGMDNILPDMLSRLYPPIEEDRTLEEENERQIRKLQKFILIKRANEHTKNKKNNSSNNREQFIRRTKVHSHDKHLNILAIKLNKHKNDPLEYESVPIEDRDNIIREVHALGHFGVDHVVRHIHTHCGLHWHSIYADCKRILKECKPCAQHNITRRGYNPQKSTFAFYPFDVIAIDTLGPFPMTAQGNIYIIVISDLLTKFIIARPIPNKQSDTIAKVLLEVFANFSCPTHIVSDNGTEYKNTLLHKISNALGIKRRFSNPFYPQSNGSGEAGVKLVLNTLRKMCGNDTSAWDEMLPICQYMLNIRVHNKTGSTPFSLMFGRQVRLSDDKNKSRNDKNTDKDFMSIAELQKQADAMSNVVFPAIRERTRQIIEQQNKRFNDKHYLIDIPVGSTVMVRLSEGRANKLAPLYEGPYTVVKRTKANSYVLKDEQGVLLHREYVPSELKLVSIDETAIEDEIYEVEDIRDHKDKNGVRLYLVKWAGYGERENSWLEASAFNSPMTIKKYWDRVRELEKLEQQRKDTLYNKGNSNSKARRNVGQKNITTNIIGRKRKQKEVYSPSIEESTSKRRSTRNSNKK